MYDKPTIIDGSSFVDDRGILSFCNTFNFEGVKRFYQVQNHAVNYIRAWHGHEREAKYVYVVSGSALVGAVNMKTEEINKFVLSSQTPKILFVPEGYANGFKTLAENTVLMFFSTSSLEESKGDDIRYDYDHWNIWKEDYR